MSRPDDIPQDVWDAAGEVSATYLRSGMNCQEHFARARLAERQRAAQIARSYILTDIAQLHTNRAVAGNAGSNIAAMIEGTLAIYPATDFATIPHHGIVR
jgi:hypothetical protein